MHLAVLLCYLLLTVAATWPLSRHLFGAIPGDGFDGWQNYWNQWWLKVALIERLQNPFTTDLLYHPTGVRLYFHTLNPFNGLVTLPFQLSSGLIPAYNAVVFMSWVLAGYGAFLLARWLQRDARRPDREYGQGSWRHTTVEVLPPFVTGVIFTFAPFHMAHLLGHMQVMSLQWIPFYILYLLRALSHSVTGESWQRDTLMAGLFLILAGLCDWYFVLYLFLFSGLAMLWHFVAALRHPTDTASPITSTSAWQAAVAVALPPLAAGLLFAVVLSPILAPMVREAIQFDFMVRPVSDLYVLSASLLDFLVPNRLHTLARPESSAWPGNQIAPISERTISIGYVALALAIYAGWTDRQRATLWWASALFFLLLAMGPVLHLGSITWQHIPDAAQETTLQGWTPFALLNRLIPFMRISRSVSRYALMVQLCIALLAGLGLSVLLTRRRSGRIALAIGAFCLVAVMSEYWVAPYPLSPPDTPSFYSQLAEDSGQGAVLNLPMNFDRPGYLLYQTEHGKPLTVAYISRDDPRTLTERAPVLQHFRHLGPDIIDVDPARVGLTVLDDLGVDWVVLDRYKMPGGQEREYTSVLARAIFAGQPPDYEDERLTVYSVPAVTDPQPYIVLGELNWGPLGDASPPIDSGNADATLARRIGNGPAELALHHAPANARLEIRYHTAPGVTLSVAAEDLAGPALILPPAPDGREATIDLASLVRSWPGYAGPDSALTVSLLAGDANGVMIEKVGLMMP